MGGSRTQGKKIILLRKREEEPKVQILVSLKIKELHFSFVILRWKMRSSDENQEEDCMLEAEKEATVVLVESEIMLEHTSDADPRGDQGVDGNVHLY